MIYLAQTSKGTFLVSALEWEEACRKLKDRGVSEAPAMICGFADAVRDVQEALTPLFCMASYDLPRLAEAIKFYKEASVELSWLGGKDAESHEAIREDYAKAQRELERILKCPLE